LAGKGTSKLLVAGGAREPFVAPWVSDAKKKKTEFQSRCWVMKKERRILGKGKYVWRANSLRDPCPAPKGTLNEGKKGEKKRTGTTTRFRARPKRTGTASLHFGGGRGPAKNYAYKTKRWWWREGGHVFAIEGNPRC